MTKPINLLLALWIKEVKPFRKILVFAWLISLIGCSSTPSFNNIITPERVGPKVSDVIDEIQCEILSALKQSVDQSSELIGLQNGQYVANIDLTLDVTNNQGLDPSLSYIDPFKVMATNFTAVASAQLSEQEHRNFNLNFTLLFDKNTLTAIDPERCSISNERSGLRGNLGIAEILAAGLKYDTDQKEQNGYPYMIPAIGVGTLLQPSDPLTNSASLAPSFGSTIDFTLIYGVGGGPNWTLTHFTGANPASGNGLLNYMRTNKDTLVLSFAKVTPTAPASSANQNVNSAAGSARDNVTRMILQQLITP